jgi:exosome complex component RRP42
MSGEDRVMSQLNEDYVENLAAEGRRFDGRDFGEFRQLELEVDFITQSAGSARVQLGETDVIVGISMEAGDPYDDSPNEGVMTTSAELIPMASPEFESGPPGPEATELARVVDRGIRETDTIDFEELCIEPGESVWVCFFDMHVLDYNGNLFDACAVGALAAALSGTVPNEAEGLGEDEPIPVNHLPVSVTAMKIGDEIVFDPGLVEDEVGGPRLTVSFDENGDIAAMQKGLEGGFTPDEVQKIIKSGRDKAAQIRDQIVKATGRSI